MLQTSAAAPRRLIVAITGATGAIYGVRLLETLRKLGIASCCFVRETPFNLPHLRDMPAVTGMCGVIFPPLPAFYNKPPSIDEMVDHTVTRVLDPFALGPALSPAWQGLRGAQD